MITYTAPGREFHPRILNDIEAKVKAVFGSNSECLGLACDDSGNYVVAWLRPGTGQLEAESGTHLVCWNESDKPYFEAGHYFMSRSYPTKSILVVADEDLRERAGL